MDLEWCTLQALELRDKNKMLTNIETFEPNDLVYLLVPYSSSLQSNAQKFRQDYIGPLAIDTNRRYPLLVKRCYEKNFTRRLPY